MLPPLPPKANPCGQTDSESVVLPREVLDSIRTELTEAARHAEAEWERNQENKRKRRKRAEAASEGPSNEACAACRAAKVKCAPVPASESCARCQAGGLACVYQGQGKRGPKEGPSKWVPGRSTHQDMYNGQKGSDLVPASFSAPTRLASQYRRILRSLEENAVPVPSVSAGFTPTEASLVTVGGGTSWPALSDHADQGRPLPQNLDTSLAIPKQQKALSISNPLAVLANASLGPETRPPSPVAGPDPTQGSSMDSSSYFAKGALEGGFFGNDDECKQLLC